MADVILQSITATMNTVQIVALAYIAAKVRRNNNGSG